MKDNLGSECSQDRLHTRFIHDIADKGEQGARRAMIRQFIADPV